MLGRKILASFMLLSLVLLGSCAQKTQTSQGVMQDISVSTHPDLKEKKAETPVVNKEEGNLEIEKEKAALEAQKKALEEKARELEKKERELEAMKALQQKKMKELQNVKAEELCKLDLENGIPLVPPNAKPGECYAIGYLPPKYEYQKVKVLVDAGGEKVITIPPKYRTVTKKVLVREAGEKLICIPPVYKTVTEKVLVKPETEKIVVVRPAKYKWVTEKILVEPAKKVWKRGASFLKDAIAKRWDPQTGDILCLVEVPPKYKYIRKKVMVEPPVTKKVIIPAQYRTVTKKVLVKPATTKVVKIPPVYKTVQVKELVEPAREKRIEIPPKYDYVTKRIKVRDAKYVWVKVLCKTNMTRDTIVRLQKALKEKGYYVGKVDGIYGPLTQEAVVKFQQDHDIPITPGAVTLKVLKLLNI